MTAIKIEENQISGLVLDCKGQSRPFTEESIKQVWG
jgi:hypothetical protein